MSHTSTLARCQRAHSCARYLSRGVHAYSQYAHRPSNQTVDTSTADTRRDSLIHSVALGWYVEDLVTHCLFNFKKLRQRWEHLGQRGHINLSKSYATSLLVLYAGLQAIVFEIFPLPVSWKAAAVPLAPHLPSSQSTPLFQWLSARLFQDCTIVYLFLFICVNPSQNLKGKMLGRKGVEGGGEGDQILASMGRCVALSFWILLSTLDRQLNKKTHQLPMCLHRSWKQWESWKAEHAKPWSGVWGWVHHIYTGPQARMGKWLCTPRTSNCGVRGYTNSTSPPVLTNGFDLLLSPVQSQLWIGKQGVTWLIPSHARWYIRSLVAHLCACVCTRM